MESEVGLTGTGTYIRGSIFLSEVAQSFWLSWMELLALPWRQSIKQQETFQKLLETPMQPYVDWMLAPLTFSRKLVETSLTAMQCERERERVP